MSRTSGGRGAEGVRGGEMVRDSPGPYRCCRTVQVGAGRVLTHHQQSATALHCPAHSSSPSSCTYHFFIPCCRRAVAGFSPRLTAHCLTQHPINKLHQFGTAQLCPPPSQNQNPPSPCRWSAVTGLQAVTSTCLNQHPINQLPNTHHFTPACTLLSPPAVGVL